MAFKEHIPGEAELLHEYNCVQQINIYIDQNIAGNLSASVVADKFSISISTLHYSFKKHLLQTYQQYLEKARMNKAMEMIRQGKRIPEMMVVTGNKNRPTFYDAFKRTFQHIPATFRYDRGKDP